MSEQGQERGIVAVDGREAMRTAIIEVIGQARRSLLILSQCLERQLYQDSAVVEALKQQLLDNRHLQVRMLVADPRVAVRDAGMLTALARRLSSRFTIHEPDERGPVFSEELVLAERRSYLLLSLPKNRTATYARRDPVGGKIWSKTFDELWLNSQPSLEFRQLG